MMMPSNVEKAERAISEMPLNKSVEIREIAISAGLTARSMARFLSREKKNGTVTNHTLKLKSRRQCLWRRVQ